MSAMRLYLGRRAALGRVLPVGTGSQFLLPGKCAKATAQSARPFWSKLRHRLMCSPGPYLIPRPGWPGTAPRRALDPRAGRALAVRRKRAALPSVNRASWHMSLATTASLAQSWAAPLLRT
jgi:hypothetical protein